LSHRPDWIAKTGQRIQLSTYLFPDDAHLAEEYLDATARYLDAYIPLLGPYPFEKFAVVENFFASGLGMPSFTLLGSGIIKRHYVQPYALGHEIVHSWIGNAVFNRADRGNWVEGLTTYLANYYWHELMGDRAQARDQRRLMVQGYNLHVPPERDYPVSQFTQKENERDNAIGYQKSAMVFHLLRQEVGEEIFWRALTSLIARYRGRYAEWHDLEQVFAEESRRDLRWFFAQWLEQDGAPELSLSEAVARRVEANADLPAGSHDHSIKEALSPTPAVADSYGRWQGASSDAIASVVGREDLCNLACSAGYDRSRSRVHDLSTDPTAIVVASAQSLCHRPAPVCPDGVYG
jgi:hypothetical protein